MHFTKPGPLPEDLLKKIGLDTFIAFDVETTGLNADVEEIIQFSASRFRDGKLEETFDFFCDPGMPIPVHISELTNISDEMVKGQPGFAQRIEEVKTFFGDVPLVGHNVRFDLGFLAKYGVQPSNPIMDTVELSRVYLYFLPDRKLESLAAVFKLQTEGAHRADVDTENTGRLLLELLKIVWYYDYPLLRQLAVILQDLPGEPNHTLYSELAAYYEAVGRTAAEKSPPLHSLPLNRYGEFVFRGEDEEGAADSGKLQRVNSKDIQEVFGFQGVLAASLPDYEMRLGQMKLAEDITDAFNRGKYLVAEAGTGVGKSLAYLIPAIKWVQKNREAGYAAVISSNTKALQEQLFFKDIPFVNEHIDSDFSAVLLKGRSNYICLTKWHHVLNDLENTISLYDRPSLLPLCLWVRESRTGDIEENSGFRTHSYSPVWSRVASEPGYCTTRKCNEYGGCHLGKVRRLAQAADIVVVNHSLLLSNAAADNAILPEYPILIIDEAHNLEKSAYQYFARELAPWIADQVADKLYFSGRDNFGTLVRLNRSCGAGDSWKKEHLDRITARIQSAEEHVQNFRDSGKRFFQELLQFMNLNVRKNIQKYVQKERYLPEKHPFTSLVEVTENYLKAQEAAQSELNQLLEDLKTLDASELSTIQSAVDDVVNAVDNFTELGMNMRFLLEVPDSSWVYWLELPVDPKSVNIRISATPLDVAGEIHEKILEDRHAVIATSATLSIRHSFDYFNTRTGFERVGSDKLVTGEYESPFDYLRQARSMVCTWLPDPGSKGFDEEVGALMNRVAERFGRGTLLLTTSYQSIRNLRQVMEPHYTSKGMSLLFQSGAASRTALVTRFREKKNATLIGTESFWEGVDVPGEALEILAMMKLPFAVPTEPVVSAVSDSFKAKGLNSFIEYSVPEAVLKFKQGFGRLIRSKKDRGVVLFMDNRLRFKRYGELFTQSLPHEVWFVKNEEELMKNLERWFRR